jgi:Hydantoinase B/oxoprolinase
MAHLPIHVAVTVSGESLQPDINGTAAAVAGNLNAVPAIVESAAAYVLPCLAGAASAAAAEVPMNAGAFAPLTVRVPPGGLLDARRPQAVAAGNVETSQRVVDVLFGVLAQAVPGAVPAASQGTMNNLTFGGRLPGSGQPFAYYESIGVGVGAGPRTWTPPAACTCTCPTPATPLSRRWSTPCRCAWSATPWAAARVGPAGTPAAMACAAICAFWRPSPPPCSPNGAGAAREAWPAAKPARPAATCSFATASSASCRASLPRTYSPAMSLAFRLRAGEAGA